MGEHRLTDLDLMDMNADELGALIDNAEVGPIPTPAEQADMLAELPPADPDAPLVTVTSLRLPAELRRRVDAAAQAEGMSVSTFIRQALESVLAGRERDNLVSIDDVIRALRNVPRAAA